MHRYRLEVASHVGDETSYIVTVSDDDAAAAGDGPRLVEWRGNTLGRGWRGQIQTEAASHGWMLSSPAWPDRRRRNLSVEVTPADWPLILNQATREHRRLAETVVQHERAWHRFIADIPRKEVQVKDIAATTGFHRVWISELRRRHSSDQ